MPITEDIRNNEVLGRKYKRGELTILRSVIEKRFGPLPAWAQESPAAKSWVEREDLTARGLDAESLEGIFQ